MSRLRDKHPGSICTAIVLRAPDAAWNGHTYVGSVLTSVDETAAIATGLAYQLVRQGQFCAVVAASWDVAQRVHAVLRPHWSTGIEPADSARADAASSFVLHRDYRWRTGHEGGAPVAKSNDSPAQAVWRDGRLTISARTGRSADLAQEAISLFGLEPGQVRVIGAERPPDQAAYDAAIDAAVVARVLSCTVQVWPVRRLAADEILIFGQGIRLDDQGELSEWVTLAEQPDALRPSAVAVAVPDTGFPRRRASSLRLRAGYAKREIDDIGTRPRRLEGDLPANSDLAARLFAQESFADEWARSRGLDPVQWRLEQIQDPIGRRLIEKVAAAAQWQARDGRDPERASAELATSHTGVLRGQGFAYAQVLDESGETPQQAWAAWVVDVSVDSETGQLNLDKITVGHYLDELVIADTGDERWGKVLEQTARKLLPPLARHDQWEAREEPAYPGQAPTSLAHAGGSPLVSTALSGSAAIGLPAAAAVANAIQDATGIRLREAPFRLQGANSALLLEGKHSRRMRAKPKRAWSWSLGVVGGIAATVMATIPWRASIAPITPAPSVYSAEAIERGRLVAAAGDCMVCHTAEGGRKNAGGRAMDTPFGTIYTTNITPDPETGLGKWPYAAFERAMREGIGRDGRHLYPAFPYTSFAKMSDGDMQSLYAFLMSEPAVKAAPPETQLSFPYNLRPMMAYWNLLFHKNEQYVYDDTQTQLWNRGAYLVQGPGHCMACHSPRNALGAEKNGPRSYLSGGVVDGWTAPALNGATASAVPWTPEDVYQYLRTGHSQRHGVAAGPMAPVVESLSALPDSDIEAMAVYLASLKPAQDTDTPAAAPATTEPRVLSMAGKNLYEGACAACHDSDSGMPLFGVRPSLLLNSNVTADTPDNLIRIVLEGIPEPADSALGYMPGFANSFNDGQIVELVSYLRAKSAPERASWSDLPGAVQRVRAESARHAGGGHP